jgi:hypothetical protein
LYEKARFIFGSDIGGSVVSGSWARCEGGSESVVGNQDGDGWMQEEVM